MARKSIEDVMNEIEDFLNGCKKTGLSSKVAVPREEFDELFGELKVKIPAEIDRCKKIMRNKEAILMDARKNADAIIAEATARANQMVSETEIMMQANQQAYETVEMARVQANDMLAQAVAESNEIRLGSMQYTNDIMLGIRNYVEATMEAERANYENLIAALNNDYLVANANLDEIQNQIVEFTGDPNSVTKAPQIKTARDADAKAEPRTRTSMAQKVKQAVGIKEDKQDAKTEAKAETKPVVNIPDFITSGEKTVPNETPLEPNTTISAGKEEPRPVNNAAMQAKQETVSGQMRAATQTNAVRAAQTSATQTNAVQAAQTNATQTNAVQTAQTNAVQTAQMSATQTNTVQAVAAQEGNSQNTAEGTAPKKIKKKIVKKRNPVLHTPQTAQETVAKTLEAAAAAKTDKTVYKANGEQARAVPAMEGRVTRGPRVGLGMVEEAAATEEAIEVTEQPLESFPQGTVKSMGIIDDFSMENKF